MKNSQTEANALQTVSQIADYAPATTISSALILNGDAMERIYKFAEMMAKGTATVPRHLQGNAADCMAVVMQATQWEMNPFAVAQKTHLTPSGTLGYEAQLISAVITSRAPVTGQPIYEYIGDWDKILGKVEERKSDKGGKYYVATYTKAEESGLGVICKITLKGESAPREMKVMMSQCYPRFSTQWATDPKQQISYVAIRKWSRLYSPGTILGVYAPDEFDTPAPRDMGPAEVVLPEIPDVLLKAANLAAAAGVGSYQAFWAATGKDNRKLLDGEHDRLKGVAISVDNERTVETPAKTVTTGQPTVTYASVLDRMVASKNEDALNVAADWIGEVEDPAQRSELSAKYDELIAAMRG